MQLQLHYDEHALTGIIQRVLADTIDVFSLRHLVGLLISDYEMYLQLTEVLHLLESNSQQETSKTSSGEENVAFSIEKKPL